MAVAFKSDELKASEEALRERMGDKANVVIAALQETIDDASTDFGQNHQKARAALRRDTLNNDLIAYGKAKNFPVLTAEDVKKEIIKREGDRAEEVLASIAAEADKKAIAKFPELRDHLLTEAMTGANNPQHPPIIDPKKPEEAMGLFQAFASGNIIGAVQALALRTPYIGKRINAAILLASDNKKYGGFSVEGFKKALGEVEQQEAFAGAAAYIADEDKAVQAKLLRGFNNQGNRLRAREAKGEDVLAAANPEAAPAAPAGPVPASTASYLPPAGVDPALAARAVEAAKPKPPTANVDRTVATLPDGTSVVPTALAAVPPEPAAGEAVVRS